MLIRIALLVRKLEPGGAERQVLEIARGLPRDRFETTIVTFYPGGGLVDEAERSGLNIVCLDKRGRWDLLSTVRRLSATLRNHGCDIVHGFQGPPNLLALAAQLLTPDLRVIWGVRDSNVDFTRYDYSRKLVFWLSARLSARADMIIANSWTGADYVRRQGFADHGLRTIHNGIDTDRFRPRAEAGADLRAVWGIPKDALVVGHVARLDPKKDHATFIRAAALLAERNDAVRFVAVGGGGRDDYRHQLQDMVAAHGLESKLTWAGEVDDVAAAYNAFDVMTLSSAYGEGFPNAIGEAMACGLSCIATDCGDTGEIVGDTGAVIAPGDVDALVSAWQAFLDREPSERLSLGQAARQRIETTYSVSTMIVSSVAAYNEVTV